MQTLRQIPRMSPRAQEPPEVAETPRETPKDK